VVQLEQGKDLSIGIASLLVESWSPYKILQNSAGRPRAIEQKSITLAIILGLASEH
jgi:hypothetical protein